MNILDSGKPFWNASELVTVSPSRESNLLAAAGLLGYFKPPFESLKNYSRIVLIEAHGI